jgi:hypothetical protein
MEEQTVAKAIMGRRFLVTDSQLSTLFEYIRRNDKRRASILIKSIRKLQYVFESQNVISEDIERVQGRSGSILTDVLP